MRQSSTSSASLASVSSWSRWRLIVLRGLVWSLIGLIYAPLFAGMRILLQDAGLGHLAYVPAAAIAGAAGAAFYGAREVAILGTLVGMAVTTVLILTLPAPVGIWPIVLASLAVGVVVGLPIRFPRPCSANVPGKIMAGLAAGIAAGTLLALAEPLHASNFEIAAVVAFLVAVNGVLYVASVRWWVARASLVRGRRPCNLIEAGVIGLLAACAAAGLWPVAAPLMHALEPSLTPMVDAIHAAIPSAITGGMVGGAVGGAMLEAFRFQWVHDL